MTTHVEVYVKTSQHGGSNPPDSALYKGQLDFLLNSIIFGNLIEVFFMSVTLIEVQCKNCEKSFEKTLTEYKYQQKKGRNTFCSRSCSCSYHNSQQILNPKGTNHIANLGGKIGRGKDEYSPFRWFMKVIKQRSKEFDVDLQYLKQLWEEQKGLCVFTKWKLTLPAGSDGWKDKEDKTYRASLDRIDSSKGYVKGNVQFVSLMANLAKNNMSDEEMFKFCSAVAKNL